MSKQKGIVVRTHLAAEIDAMRRPMGAWWGRTNTVTRREIVDAAILFAAAAVEAGAVLPRPEVPATGPGSERLTK